MKTKIRIQETSYRPRLDTPLNKPRSYLGIFTKPVPLDISLLLLRLLNPGGACYPAGGSLRRELGVQAESELWLSVASQRSAAC
jgi:hypothetical protein